MGRFCSFLKSLSSAALLSSTVLVLIVLSRLPESATGAEIASPNQIPRAECTFADGSSIAFGRHISGSSGGEANTWQAGEYEATLVRVSGRLAFPPISNPVEIPDGVYPLFVMTKDQVPSMLIISNKAAAWGMPYPGKQYDLARISLGSDVAPSSESFIVGCTQQLNAPIMVWVQSGKYIGYTKLMSETVKNGRTEYSWH